MRTASLVGPAVTLALLSGCFLVESRRNTNELGTITTLKGTVTVAAGVDRPTWVLLFKQVDGRWVRYSQRVFHHSGAFEFLCTEGRYLPFAFVDQNGDRTWEPVEPAARFGSSDGIPVLTGEALETIDLTPGSLPEPLGFEVVLAAEGETHELVKVHVGDAATLADERFSAEAGNFGLWQPADFAQKWGVGVSFLEPWSPVKIPVLFVHGAGGAPADFAPLIAQLDRTRFQPWVFSYPSGIRLAQASLTLRRLLDDLQQRLGFAQLYVVAHSMGGLVARDFVTQVVQRGAPVYVSLLITLSTPWGGVEAAQNGVKRSPVVLPSWIDVATGSSYLAVLTEKPLPKEIPHYLFFGFEGGNGSDGTIALKSQLDPRAQRWAKQVLGFPEDHTSILLSSAVSKKLNLVLGTP